MFHWRARQLLTRALDETLPASLAQALDAHLSRCARCRRYRHEHALCETFLSELPHVFAPLEPDPASYPRLVALTRWSPEGAPRERQRYTPPILALASATTLVMLAATMSLWSPIVRPTLDPVSIVSYQTHAMYGATEWQTGRF